LIVVSIAMYPLVAEDRAAPSPVGVAEVEAMGDDLARDAREVAVREVAVREAVAREAVATHGKEVSGRDEKDGPRRHRRSWTPKWPTTSAEVVPRMMRLQHSLRKYKPAVMMSI
jgi:hypothetical protein